MTEILQNEYYSTLIILISQIIFIYLRTLNVIYTADKRMLAAILTGNGIGISWLISMSISINSVMEGQLLPILAFLVGGTLGTYFAIKKESKKNVTDDKG